MTEGPQRNKAETRRFHAGPRPIGAVLPAVTRPLFRKEGALLGQLLADWPSIVGTSLSRTTSPRRVSAGTLTLGCSGPVALELQHLAGPLIERVNAHLGRVAVQRLRFVQEAPAAQAPRPEPRRRVPLAPIAVDGLPDGPLRDALGALGAALRAKSTERA